MNEYASPGHYTPLTGKAGADEFAALAKIEEAKLAGTKLEQSCWRCVSNGLASSKK